MSSIAGTRHVTPVMAEEPYVSWPVVMLFFLLTISSLMGVTLTTVLMLLFMFLVLCCWIPMSGKLPPLLDKLLLPFISLLLIGGLGLYENPSYEVFKDVWYVAMPVLSMAVGFVLMWNLCDWRRLLRICIVVGAVVSFVHIIRFIQHPELLSLSANDMRNTAGRGYLISIIAVGALLAAWKLNYKLFPLGRWVDVVMLMLCVVSIGLSLSRVMAVSCLLMLGSILGIVNFTDHKKVIKVVAVIAVGFAVLMLLPKPHFIGQNSTFVEKILFSMKEMEVRDYNSITDINTRWRGYETARAFITYSKGEYWQYLTGRGFGTSIDLGLFMPMGDEPIRFAPILHNGYMYLLVKTGVMGLLIYLLFLVNIIKLGNSCMRLDEGGDRVFLYAGRFIVGVACVFAASTFVISGPFNKQALVPVEIFLGAVVAQAARRMPSIQSAIKGGGIRPSPLASAMLSKE